MASDNLMMARTFLDNFELMIPLSFGTKLFEEIVIETSDKKLLYFPKILLAMNSKYFKTLFENSETPTLISLPYESRILTMIFECIVMAISGSKFIEEQYLSKLDNTDIIFDFITVCAKFEMKFMKDSCDIYFSDEARLKNLCCNKLVRIIKECKMSKMKRILAIILQKDNKIFDSFKFIEMTDDEVIILFFTKDWDYIIDTFAIWINYNSHVLVDEKMSHIMKMNFTNVPIDRIKDVHKIINVLPGCPNFQLKVYKDLAVIMSGNDVCITKDDTHVNKKARRTGTD